MSIRSLRLVAALGLASVTIASAQAGPVAVRQHSGDSGDVHRGDGFTVLPSARAPGRDERMRIQSYHEGQEFLYRLTKALTQASVP